MNEEGDKYRTDGERQEEARANMRQGAEIVLCACSLAELLLKVTASGQPVESRVIDALLKLWSTALEYKGQRL